jgi:hypothetical protein
VHEQSQGAVPELPIPILEIENRRAGRVLECPVSTGAFSGADPPPCAILLHCMSPVMADFVAKVCDYGGEAAASISWNGSHHPLFEER